MSISLYSNESADKRRGDDKDNVSMKSHEEMYKNAKLVAAQSHDLEHNPKFTRPRIFQSWEWSFYSTSRNREQKHNVHTFPLWNALCDYQLNALLFF